MAGTETGMKYLQRKLAALRAPDSDEGKITQTEAYQSPAAIKRNKLFGGDLDSQEAKKASADKRMDMWREEKGLNEVDAIRDAMEKARAEKKGMSVQQMRKNMSDEYDRKMKEGEFYKKGGAIKAKGWGTARGARAAKVY